MPPAAREEAATPASAGSAPSGKLRRLGEAYQPKRVYLFGSRLGVTRDRTAITNSARRLGRTHAEAVRRLLDRVALVELAPPVLSRALEPFPTPVRTLDALHLASVEFLRGRGQSARLASCDDRMLAAAQALDIPLAPL